MGSCSWFWSALRAVRDCSCFGKKEATAEPEAPKPRQVRTHSPLPASSPLPLHKTGEAHDAPAPQGAPDARPSDAQAAMGVVTSSSPRSWSGMIAPFPTVAVSSASKLFYILFLSKHSSQLSTS